MNYIREFLYRPKRSDRSNMARFFYADENLTAVAAELDSFDGRKDPERCACLVNRLRSCQDKLINICNRMLEELEPGTIKRSREFRAKYPDDIMNDNLAGQLWFGAECLAAGSSIMNKEGESESMRPLAKAVTKSLEKVRALLREQCLSPQPEYTESIREHLKIFDRLFADFEFNYVRCMVHVKTTKEYELHQDLIVLFSETLMRAIKEELVTQDAVDFCDPSLMFAIPRLAIVYGLLVCNKEGPLNVDRSSTEFPALFLPFKNLLRKIRELLYTLEANEVRVLEMLLCNLEEPANISNKLKEVQRSMEEREKTLEGKVQALKLQAKLTKPSTSPEEHEKTLSQSRVKLSRDSQLKRLNSIPCACADESGDGTTGAAAPTATSKAEAEEIVAGIVESLLREAVDRSERRHKRRSSKPQVEIDCTGPEIEVRVSPNKSAGDATTTPSFSSSRSAGHRSSAAELETRSGSSGSRHHASLKRHNARRDTKRIPLRYQKDRRAKFKSTEDLLHRLYVCISGAADQLQSNYAGDFRSILRSVFVMNNSPDDEDEEDSETVVDAGSGVDVGDGSSGAGVTFESQLGGGGQHSTTDSLESPVTDDGAMAIPSMPLENGLAEVSPPSVLPPHALQIDVATDAIQHDQIRSMYDEQLRGNSSGHRIPGGGGATAAALQGGGQLGPPHRQRNSYDSLTNGEEDEVGGHQGAVYAQNLDLVSQQFDSDGLTAEVVGPTVSEGLDRNQEFYQSEPTLLDIAQGAAVPVSPVAGGDGDHHLLLNDTSPREISVPESAFYHQRSPRGAPPTAGSHHGGRARATPPPWIPDEAASACMGCDDTFNLLRRRHHCRACGKVFCGRCSGHSMPLPQFNLDRPVRVCNRCKLMLSGPQVASGNAQTVPGSEATSPPPSANSQTSGGNGSGDSAQHNFFQRNFGMVS